MKHNSFYCGWRVRFDQTRQVHVAERYGVTMNHTDLARLVEMIDARVKDRSAGRSYV